ncbi:hypothetical protein R3P38DRAFT_2518839 [Favolaschia claudopus]|uniref:Integrase catalytic domain-containing protein n=1 Tax=Favolaschia claudopus TaxID=2862362 RepID=A0AAW0C8J0_9AGAR
MANSRKAGSSNQHLPCPPDEELAPLIRKYFALGYPDPKIALECMDHFDKNVYGLSSKTVKRRRKAMGLLSTVKQAVTWEELEPIYRELRQKFPNLGARDMVAKLRILYGIKISEMVMLKYLRQHDSEGIQRRKAKRFRRKRFWSAGVMDILCFDQHDKWKRFELWLHLGMDPFNGRLAWIKIWWSNRNSKLVTSYYINACREIGRIPMITQSGLGSENFGIANCHTETRQRLDVTLVGTLQHRWVNKKAMNVKPEAQWAVVRRNFSVGYEDCFNRGTVPDEFGNILLDILDALQQLIIRWLAIPWIQHELDTWRLMRNSTPRRSDKHSLLPHGIPDMIAEKFQCKDYKVNVPSELFDEMESRWTPPDDPIFDLVPPEFGEQITGLYQYIGAPVINIDSFWDVYCDILNCFTPQIQYSLAYVIEHADDHFEESPDKLAGQADLPEAKGDWQYLGGDLTVHAAIAAEEEEDEGVEFTEDEAD